MKKADIVIKGNTFDLLSLEREGGTQCRVRGKDNRANLIGTPSSALWASSPSRGKWMRGFTLIELLAVVLIIGILAAVAVPQYQKAVLKSRYVLAKTHAETLWKSEQVYYMANQAYTGDIEKLDVSIAGLNCTYKEDRTASFCRFGEAESALADGCDLYSGHIVCFIRSGILSGHFQYRLYFTSEHQRRCITATTSDLNAVENKICAQETGVSKNQTSGSGNRYWYYD